VEGKVVAASTCCLSKAIVNGHAVEPLIDTGSSESFISSAMVKDHKWKVYTAKKKVTMASTSL